MKGNSGLVFVFFFFVNQWLVGVLLHYVNDMQANYDEMLNAI